MVKFYWWMYDCSPIHCFLLYLVIKHVFLVNSKKSLFATKATADTYKVNQISGTFKTDLKSGIWGKKIVTSALKLDSFALWLQNLVTSLHRENLCMDCMRLRRSPLFRTSNCCKMGVDHINAYWKYESMKQFSILYNLRSSRFYRFFRNCTVTKQSIPLSVVF